MVTDGQVRKLRRLLAQGDRLGLAARRTGMDEKTARKYRDAQGLPSEGGAPRDWRTRPDPFAEVWPEVQAQLEGAPRLRAFTLFAWLQDRYPGRFPDSQRRTFERRVRDWRGLHGPSRPVMFPQVHDPGGLGASDFTNMNALGVTINRQPFNHLLYHFTLTYSNWEFVSVCFSESFEAVSRGFQQAVWRLGGAPRRHRSDSLSAAVNNLSEDREFRSRYQDLMDYYQVEPQRINVRQAHENGDVESSHGHLKTAVDQALLLRGSRDFASRAEYDQFLTQLIDKRNAARADKFAEEQACLGELPPGKLDHRQRLQGVKVHSSSTIQVKRNTYSVPSQLIGGRVDVVIDAEAIEVWWADVLIQTMPRLPGGGKHAINYRHVIDSLVRKPGAFEHYQYQADLFPTSHFRIAYDALLRDHSPRVAAREYLQILQLAARDSQDAVQDALRLAIAENAPITADSIRSAVARHQQAPPLTEIHVEPPDLQQFDSLLQHFDMEVEIHEYAQETDARTPDTSVEPSQPRRESHEAGPLRDIERRVDRTVEGASLADVPPTLREPRGAGRAGTAEPYAVPGGAGGVGVSNAAREPDHAPARAVATPFVEDLEQLPVGASAVGRDSSNGKSARRLVPGPPRELVVVRQAGLGQEPPAAGDRAASLPARLPRPLHHQRGAGQRPGHLAGRRHALPAVALLRQLRLAGDRRVRL